MILALLKDQQEEAQRVAYSLYRKGLTTQDVAEVFEELYGKKYSTSQVSRMFDYARKEAEEWLARPLENYYPILYIDALYASTRRGDSCSKEAYFSVLAVKSDKTREVLGIYNNPHESASFWDEILQNLRNPFSTEFVKICANKGQICFLPRFEDGVPKCPNRFCKRWFA